MTKKITSLPIMLGSVLAIVTTLPAVAAPAPSPVPVGVCGDAATLISAIQGSVAASPEKDNFHVVEAVIHQLASGYSGVFIQEEAADYDADPQTSEGLFVYLGSDYDTYVATHSLDVGTKLRLTGKVSEYNNVTQLGNISDQAVCAQGSVVAPTAIEFPLAAADQLEALEGMSVNVTSNMLVSDFFGNFYSWMKNGQFLASTQLHYQPNAIAVPSKVAFDTAVDNRILDSILVDDGTSWKNPDSMPFPTDAGFSNTNYIRVGYTLSGLEGAIHGSGYYKDKIAYALIPSAAPTFDSAGFERTLEPTVDRSGNLTVASMNVLNLFNGLEDSAVNGGLTFFPTKKEVSDNNYNYRGAYSESDYMIQRGKIVKALAAIDADLIGLMEIENDGFGELSAIQDLVKALNAEMPVSQQYTFVNPNTVSGKIGTDAIAVGLLYRSGVLTPKGQALILDSDNSPVDDNGDALFLDSKNRPSLIQTFVHTETGETFTASINHLKSKGSTCASLGDPELEDGSGNCNETRTRAVEGLVKFINQSSALDASRLLIMGDMNSYAKETPIAKFEEAGIVNLKSTDKATEAKPFSYSYGGMLGSLDYILANDKLTDELLSIDAWHINSLESPAFDYDTNLDPYDSNDTYAEIDPFYSSDHDPIIAAFNLVKAEPAPTPAKKKGGSMGAVSILLFAFLAVFRKFKIKV
ncbi:ExeM/NucH family extracellular endonuclease [Reinekea sp.]|jgi:predicted extracellular nuclease|uniref:ExeM/NucH family extracellular endonuclease n=1 Tax=Reinekea sp. TaxID=1970455 RepID=UPI003989B423